METRSEERREANKTWSVEEKGDEIFAGEGIEGDDERRKR
jgi:hypothetical protein